MNFILIIFLLINSEKVDSLSLKIKRKKDARTIHTIIQGATGLSIYSWLVPLGFKIKDKTGLLVGLWTPFVWTTGQYVLAKASYPVTKEQAILSGWGAFDGLLHGIFLKDPEENGFLFPLVMSFTENIGGFFLAKLTKPTRGIITRRILQSINGYVLGSILSRAFNDIHNEGKWIGTTSILLGYGSYALSLIYKDNFTTSGDALFEFVSANALGLSFTLLSNNNEKTQYYAYALGNCMGYALGVYLSKKNNLSFSKGILSLLIPSMVSGAMIGSLALAEVDENTLSIASAIIIPFNTYATYYILK